MILHYLVALVLADKYFNEKYRLKFIFHLCKVMVYLLRFLLLRFFFGVCGN
jgi:hypothetical protein